MQELLAAQPGATADTVTAVADWAQVLVLATPSWEPERAGEQIAALAVALGPGAGGKALIDVVNGVSGWPALCLPWEGGPSTSELLAQALPGTAVFKGAAGRGGLAAEAQAKTGARTYCPCRYLRAPPLLQTSRPACHLPHRSTLPAFSTVGVEQLAAPDGSRIDGRRLTMLLAGPPERRAEAEAVVAGVGFAPKYVGPIRYARNLDAIAELWCAGRARTTVR